LFYNIYKNLVLDLQILFSMISHIIISLVWCIVFQCEIEYINYFFIYHFTINFDNSFENSYINI